MNRWRVLLAGILGPILWAAAPAQAQRTVGQLGAQGNAGEIVPAPTFSIDVTDAPLRQVIDDIVRKSGVRVAYGPEVTGSKARVTLKGSFGTAEEAVAKALAKTGLVVAKYSGHLAVVAGDGAKAAEAGVVAGRVIDAKTKLPLKGVMITIDNVPRGALTGDDGAFRLSGVSPGTHRVTIRFLGYTKQVQTVTVPDGDVVRIEVALEPSVSALDQVVVTGTVAATAQREVPNALTVITAQELQQRGIRRIDQLFRGDVPGVFAMNPASDATLDEVTVFSRGATQMKGYNTNPIKTYVDGVEISDPSYISQIDPTSIERIEILAGPQASTIYGSNAINGVMQIFTKQGVSRAPQFTGAWQTGWIQNDFSSALTPQHDVSAQLAGTDRQWSYSVGGSWNYLGPWTPAKQTGRTGGFGGLVITTGPLITNLSGRLALTSTRTTGDALQAYNEPRSTGEYAPDFISGRSAPSTSKLNGQTLGATFTYHPINWWSNNLTVGTDASNSEFIQNAPKFGTPSSASDTLLSYWQQLNRRNSIRYTTDAQVTLSNMTRLTLTGGIDQWRSMYNYAYATTSTVNGDLNGSSWDIQRLVSRSSGAFLQGQVALWDQLFLTGGVRAEWNPNYGADANPNVAPRYGAALAHDVGPLTVKLRGAYGKATRPPLSTQKLEQFVTSASLINLYGRYRQYLGAPDLGPESQQGAEGGLELYYGSLASLVLTRYNQTVDGLIYAVRVDSAQSLAPSTGGTYSYAPIYQYLNVASIRNQGWEAQGQLTLGPISTKGTYSWTKSRVLGVTPKYLGMLNLGQQFVPGAAFRYLPEHTWALSVAYARAADMVTLSVNGTGFLYNSIDELFDDVNSMRLPTNKLRMSMPATYINTAPGYTMTDLNASHRFSRRFEAVMQVRNLFDFYRSDRSHYFATIGRQTMFGVRIR